MLLSKICTFFGAMVLAGCVAAAPMPLEDRQLLGKYSRMTVGYRTVSPAQAEMYNEAGRLTWDPVRKSVGNQLGYGVYTTPGAGQWLGADMNDWHCQITARKQAWLSIPKVWVPENEWWGTTQELEDWSRRMFPTVDPKKSLRMSMIATPNGIPPHFKQLVIPPTLLTGNGLDLQVKCKPFAHQLSNSIVDYYNWPNTFGDAQR